MKPGRNDPCPCGSGKKYKKCCLQKKTEDRATESVPEEREKALEEKALMAEFLIKLRRLTLDRKPHIKAYYKMRNMHSEMVDTMIRYHEEGNFVPEADSYEAPQGEHNRGNDIIYLLESDFDLDTREGLQAFYDILIYKNAPNMNCITELFIKKHRYRKEEKVAFLHSMLASRRGLFEVTGTDADEGYAFLKEVFTGAQYTITDVALSGAGNDSKRYIYTRIIEYQDICFSSGLNLVFSKSDRFIQDHIRHHRKNYQPNGELIRFTQLYNQFSKDPNSIKVFPNTIWR